MVAAVFVQADARDEEAPDEVGWVTGLSREYPWIAGIVAYAPVHAGSAVEPRLEFLAHQKLVVGVRRLLQGLPAESVTASRLVEGVRRLSVYGLTFDICATCDQLPAVAVLVEACPQTTFVLDHLGKPPVASGRLDPWRRHLTRIAVVAQRALQAVWADHRGGPRAGDRPTCGHSWSTRSMSSAHPAA